MSFIKYERRYLNRFFIFSDVTFGYAIIINGSLILPHTINGTLWIVNATNICICLLGLFYFDRKIFQLLIEKDAELRFRSTKAYR